MGKADWAQVLLLALSLCLAVAHDVLAAPLLWTSAWVLLVAAVLLASARAVGAALPRSGGAAEVGGEEVKDRGLVEELRWRLRLGESLRPEDLEAEIFRFSSEVRVRPSEISK